MAAHWPEVPITHELNIAVYRRGGGGDRWMGKMWAGDKHAHAFSENFRLKIHQISLVKPVRHLSDPPILATDDGQVKAQGTGRC